MRPRVGEYFIGKLRELKLRYDCIGDVRGKGLMLGMELVENRYQRELRRPNCAIDWSPAPTTTACCC